MERPEVVLGTALPDHLPPTNRVLSTITSIFVIKHKFPSHGIRM
jgi:hypothetical protein